MAFDRDRSHDEPDWARPVFGPVSWRSILERRSTIINDNEVEAPDAPPLNITGTARYGKFFTRGCRGLLERIEIYSTGDAAGQIELWVTPHPCLGPIHQVLVTPGVGWAWYGVDIEEMWDYDSLFIWVQACNIACSYGYDAMEPFDAHITGDGGDTWDDRDMRFFIRAIYTGETPGDVPISGIINNIVIPNASSEMEDLGRAYTAALELALVPIDGIGDVDLIILAVDAAAGSHNTRWRIYCDWVVAFDFTPAALTALGLAATTPGITELTYAVNGLCVLLITKRFQFRKRFSVSVQNAANQTIDVYVFPNLLG